MKALSIAQRVLGSSLWNRESNRGPSGRGASTATSLRDLVAWPLSHRRDLVLGVGCFVAYVTAFFLASESGITKSTDGPLSAQSLLAICWLTAAPAITVGWTWGMRAGFFTGIAMSPLNAILFSIVGLPGWYFVSAVPLVWAQAIAPLAGAVFGRLHELNCAVQAEREQSRGLQKELALTRRSLDATLQLLNDQATLSHQNLEAKSRAEAESQRSLQELNHTKIRLSHSTLTDIRTDLPNRRAALEFLNQEWTVANQRNRPLGCISVNVNEIAPIRALRGLETSDQVVRETAEILRDSIRETDRLFSLGGEEFLVVCPNIDDQQLFECAERLRALVEVNTVVVSETPFHVSMSVGIANKNDPTISTADSLLRRAQQALLFAQDQGANRVVCLTSTPDADVLHGVAASEELQRRIGG